MHSWTAEFLYTFWQADFPAILAALILFVYSVLREEFASLFQTFSRNDLPGEAALLRGRYVFKKKRKSRRRYIRERASQSLQKKIAKS